MEQQQEQEQEPQQQKQQGQQSYNHLPKSLADHRKQEQHRKEEQKLDYLCGYVQVLLGLRLQDL